MVLAVQTPHRETEGATESQGPSCSLDSIDVEWVAEHARQVGNMCRLNPLQLCIMCTFCYSLCYDLRRII